MFLKAHFSRMAAGFTRTLRIMKLTTTLLLLAFLTTSGKGLSQTVTLSEKNTQLEKVFNNIKKQTGYRFLYTNEMLLKAGLVTVSLKSVELTDALKIIFSDQPLDFEIIDKTIVVKFKSTSSARAPTPSEDNAVLLVTVTGRVTNSQGEPLGGAYITIKRTGKGTITNANGEFSLRDVNTTDIMVISFVNYKTLSVTIANRTSFTLIMEVATSQLDNVVIQGYGVTSDRLRTGNIGKISAEELQKHPVINPVQILQGLVPGAVVTNVSGYASASVKVEIRGRNTIDPNLISEPLYIVDGVPLTILNVDKALQTVSGGTIISQGSNQTGIASPAGGQSPFFNINPADIESVEILKDADATAIYGSRAANGVILITTKKGKVGKTKAEVNIYTGFSKVTRFYSLLNTLQYVEMRKEALANDGLTPDIFNATDLVQWDTTRYTDWQKYAYGSTGKVVNVQASVSGGDARTTFRTAAGYTYQRDVTTVSGGNRRGSFSLNLNHKSLNHKLSLSWSAMYSIASIDLVPSGGSTLLPPNAPAVFDDNGNLNYAGWGLLSMNFPFGSLLQPYKAQTNLLNSSFLISYELLKGLQIKTNVGYNNSHSNQNYKMPIASQNPFSNPTGTLQVGNTFFRNLIIEPQVDYNFFLGEGKFHALIGATTQTNVTDALHNIGNNYTSDLLLESLNNAPNKTVINNYGQYKYAGVFGRLNYNWKNKYIANFNSRRDGSSRFGPGRQFGDFGSVGGAWIFTEEKFMKGIPFISFGKARVSYGVTGSDQINDYSYLHLWRYGSVGIYNSLVPLSPTGLADSLLRWERNKKLEASISLGFLKDRIVLEASWYQNRCDNQLVLFPTPALSGFTSVYSNTPANVENKGWEFILNTKIIDKKNLQWTARLNVGINRNRLLSYPNFSQSPFKARYEIGGPLNIQRYLQFIGVDPQTGDYMFEDKNHDGQITKDFTGTTEDDRFIYDFTPKFDGGFSTGLSYRNWDFSMFFYFRKQIGLNANSSTEIPGGRVNQSTDVLNRWQKPNDNAPIGRFTTFFSASGNDYAYFSDARVSDASFIRLQNISISYRLPEKLRKKLGVGNCNIFMQGENLLLITKYEGVDPEVQSIGALPRPAIATIGISCNF